MCSMHECAGMEMYDTMIWGQIIHLSRMHGVRAILTRKYVADLAFSNAHLIGRLPSIIKVLTVPSNQCLPHNLVLGKPSRQGHKALCEDQRF